MKHCTSLEEYFSTYFFLYTSMLNFLGPNIIPGSRLYKFIIYNRERCLQSNPTIFCIVNLERIILNFPIYLYVKLWTPEAPVIVGRSRLSKSKIFCRYLHSILTNCSIVILEKKYLNLNFPYILLPCKTLNPFCGHSVGQGITALTI